MSKKKILYIEILLFITLFVSLSYFSYAFFIRKDEYHGKLNIVAGTLDYKITSKALDDNNTVVLKGNKTKKFDIEITSLNSINSKYELYYLTDNGNVEVGYSNKSSYPTGTIEANKKKNITIRVSNNSNSDAKITFKVVGGFTHNELVKKEGITISSLSNLCSISLNSVTSFNYYEENGEAKGQVYDVLCNGVYKIEAWGSQGGDSINASGGAGSYVSGKINLNKNNKLYVYVGGKGNTTKQEENIEEDEVSSYGFGGGSTDIRLASGNWNLFNSLKSRIMVAAGGGGAFSKNTDSFNGGAGGGLFGIKSYDDDSVKVATQVSNGINNNYTQKSGGNGYYNGASFDGGSSFISGHLGCVAMKEESTEDNIIQRDDSNKNTCTIDSNDINCSYHYSDYVFKDTVMIDGEGYKWTDKKEKYQGQPQPDGSVTRGHLGNGYVRITYIEE